MRILLLQLILIILLLTFDHASARILNVPDDHNTIQAGIDAAEDGDTVLVQPGVYTELVSIEDRSLTLAGRFILSGDMRDVDSTYVNGDRQGNVVSIIGRNEANVKLVGITVINGESRQYEGAGGICVENHSQENPQPLITAEILGCIVTGNDGDMHGGGISASGMIVLSLANCEILDNRGEFGGGLYLDDKVVANIESCSFYANVASYGGAISTSGTIDLSNVVVASNDTRFGGGCLDFQYCDVTLNIVTIANNSGSGLQYTNDSDRIRLSLTNSILYGNSEDQLIYDSVEDATSSCFLMYCDIEGGEDGIVDSGAVSPVLGEGNLDSDPLFLDPENGDYHLSPDSPCIDTGDPEAPLDPDGTRADMGAFYFHQKDIEVYPPDLAFGQLPFGEVDSQLVVIANTGGTELNFQISSSNPNSNITIRQADGRDLVVEPNSGRGLWAFYRPAEGLSGNQTFLVTSDDPDEPEFTIEATEVLTASDPTLSVFDFQLSSAYPNPFNSTTKITFSVGAINRSATKLAVYDLSGRLVQGLVNGPYAAGEHSVLWNAEGLPGGVYLVRLEAGLQTNTSKAVLLK